MARITTEHIAEVLTENYCRMLERARRTLRSEADAEDVVQDVTLTLLNAPHLLAGVERVTSWLLTLVYRRSIDIIRRERRRDEWASEDVIAALFPKERAENRIDDELLEAACEELSKLPDVQRNVIIANVVQGLSFKEISEQTGVPMGTLTVRKKRGLDAVRSRLSRRGFDIADVGRSAG